jgi:ribose 5-phosphate isomerase A
MDIKDKVGKEAASLIKNGMTVGIGSGTTAACFIRHLAARCLEGLSISGVPT